MPSTVHDELQHVGYAIIPRFLDDAEIAEVHEEVTCCIQQFARSSPPPLQTNERVPVMDRLATLASSDRTTISGLRQALSHIGAVKRLRSQIFTAMNLPDGLASTASLVFSLPGEPWPLRFWHQEAYANSAITSTLHLTLSESNSENGGLRVANGGPWRDLLCHEALDERRHWKRLVDQSTFEARNTQLSLVAGDLVVIDALTPHAGGPNRSTRARLFLAVRVLSP